MVILAKIQWNFRFFWCCGGRPVSTVVAAASIVGAKRGQAEDKDVPIEKIASESYIEPRFRS